MKNDAATIEDLNRVYIDCVKSSDANRFNEILGDDFLCSLSDGRLINREEFLEYSSRPVTISNLEAHDVMVRILGDTALVHARTTYTYSDGKPGAGRYTDVWARRNGRWLAVAAHFTRG